MWVNSSAVKTAFLLGAAGGTCLSLSMSPSVSPFAIYVVLLVTFHVSEYVLAGAYRPDTASHDSFLLQHSRAYQLMVLVCWLEYWLEWFGGAQPWPGWKEWGAVPSVGLVVCSAGLLARAVGIATASSNFSHQIEEQKRELEGREVVDRHGHLEAIRGDLPVPVDESRIVEKHVNRQIQRQDGAGGVLDLIPRAHVALHDVGGHPTGLDDGVAHGLTLGEIAPHQDQRGAAGRERACTRA